MSNHRIAKILQEISIFLYMDDVAFKPQAYERAAQVVGGLDQELGDLYREGGIDALIKLPGIGESIAEKIVILLTKGKLPYYEKLRKKYPVDVLQLSKIEGIGPRHLKKFYENLRVKNIADLKQAIEKKKLEKVRGLGKKTAENIKRSVQFLEIAGSRFLLGEILPKVEGVVAKLREVSGVNFIQTAGSVRRMKETVGDVDLVASAKNPERLMDVFVGLPGVAEVLAKGPTKSLIRFDSGLDMDIRVVPAESIGSAMLYFTGSREHQVELRRMAIKKGWTLNEYGLFTNHKKDQTKRKRIAGQDEQGIYHSLGLEFIPPEMREMTGEIDVALKNKIPKLVDYSDLKGDLQVQTNWTDGNSSIEEMALAAKSAGLEYLVITDHTKHLAFAGGLDEKRLKMQIKEIARLNKKFKGDPLILSGAEVNILKDGSLDISDEILAKLDVVGAAVHDNFRMPEREMTERICQAMRNKNIDILFHPTGRLINRRPPYAVDIEKIINTAKQTGTVLEIDAAPDRLDLKDSFIKKAREAGVRFAIDSDAHDPEHFNFLRYGIGQARRGWATKSSIINAHSAQKMLGFLKDRKKLL